MVATYAWLCGGELPSQRLRSYTFGLAAAAGFFAAWLTTFTAPCKLHGIHRGHLYLIAVLDFINPDSLNWGPRYGYIWCPSSIIAGIWVFFFLPEVKGKWLHCERMNAELLIIFCTGRTLEEIDEMVRTSHPTVLSILMRLTDIELVQFEAKLPARKFRGYTCIRRLSIEEKPDTQHEE